MNPDSNSRAEQLFADALARPENERAAFLDMACDGDAALKERVIALLKAHASPESLLAGAPVRPMNTVFATHEEKPGDVIGRYKLLQKIGEGGCGVVWMAEQEEPVRRRVAFKVIKLGMDTREVIARFTAERQALALMDHPGIAKVLDGGATDSGRPYFVMELVRGIPITRFCDEQNLTIRARLELFRRVCEAVQHAHQKGIIHRDLKPSNILVALHQSEPVPVVIDFGIAKAIQGRLTDATVFTRYDQIIGTPAYMSPEQADTSGLDIDTRTDVYSLGVVLYELLAGRCPFEDTSHGPLDRDEIRRLVRELEPPRPSTRYSSLPGRDRENVARRRSIEPGRLPVLLSGDLDWIVMKALEKNRARRYDTPSSLGEDIGRHLRNEPVQARAAGRFYRARKFVRRNRVAVATASGMALMLVVGSVVSVSQAVRAWRAERVASAEKIRATGERARSDDLLTFMLEELRAPLARVGELAVLDRVVEKALQHFASRDPRDPDDRTRVNHVRVLNSLGGLRMDQARFADAEAAYRDAQAHAAAIVARNPRNASALLALADAEWGNGFVRYQRGQVGEAREWFQRERQSRAALVALEPDNREWQLNLATQQGNLAALMIDRDPDFARAGYRAQLETLTKLLTARPDDTELQRSSANATAFLGTLAEAAGDFAEAAERFAREAALLAAIAQADAKDPHWKFKQSEGLVRQAGLCLIVGRPDEAARHLERAHQFVAPLVEQDGKNRRWRTALSAVELKQALLAQARGDLPRAAAVVAGVTAQWQALAEKEPSDVWTQYRLCVALRIQAELQHALGRPEAADTAARAIAAGERLIRRDNATLLQQAERAAAGVIAARIANARGESAAALAQCQRANSLLAGVEHRTKDWRILDPAARLARLIGQRDRAATIIAQLRSTGYVPLEPWPEPMTISPSSEI